MIIESPISYILFDACETLMHKPALWKNIMQVLTANGHQVEKKELQHKHKLLSECIHFPDRTSKSFYQKFNAEVLYALGIIPTDKLLEQIFEACTYLPWVTYEDTAVLEEIKLPMGVLSNFNSTLKDKLDDLIGDVFEEVLISEVLGVAKPAITFYEKAIKKIGVPPAEILYIGDSLKLDIQPALAVGMQPLLIDRIRLYPNYVNRLDSLSQLNTLGLW